ncbi:MAG: PAS domain S-box protein [Rhizobiaceae bacterium]
MTTGGFSFIDIAVLDGVRERFAAGDPLILLSSDLETLLWVNGPGAALLGFDDIEQAMGAELDLPVNVRRQIAATAGFPAIDRDRSVTIRLDNWLESRALWCRGSSILLPDRQRGILLTVPGSAPAGLAAAKMAARSVAGIDAPGHYAALVDASGAVMAGSTGFADLAIAPATMQALVHRVAGETDRLVKRMVPTAAGEAAVGIGRLVDDPALHLVIAVGEPVAGTPAASVVAAPAEHAGDAEHDVAADDPLAEPAGDDVERQVVDRHEAAEDIAAVAGDAVGADEMPEDGGSGEDEPAEALRPAVFGRRGVVPEERERESGDGEKSQAGFEAVRFVWKTDEDGRFSEISPEFAAAVGAANADIIGRSFGEVAGMFDFDSTGEIEQLLERRDTWSGRSVLWPLRDTGKRVPVDLAALPAYSRHRHFEGFRGFGVVRLSEAVEAQPLPRTDDEAETAAAPEEAPADTDRQTAGDEMIAPDDPFRGELPALELSRTPERRDSDKVIRLAAHRERAGGLSDHERTAFREIGERLKEADAGDRRSGTANENPPPSENGLPEEPLRELAADSPAGVGPGGADGSVDEPVRDATGGHETVSGAETDVQTGSDAGEEISAAEPDEAGQKASGPAAADFLPSAFAEPTDWPEGGSDISILEQLPVAVLIRSGDTLHYANPEFFKLTGYRSTGELAEAGGFDVLFAAPDGLSEESDETARPAMRLITQDGSEKLCDAYLRSVRWEDRLALMLAIRPSPLAAPAADAGAADGGLSERVRELTAILDTATDGVVLVTPSGDIRSINRSAEALFGFEADELAGKPFTVLFATESQRAAADYLSGLAENGVASVLNDGREVIGREAQGRFIPLFMTMGRLPGPGGYCAVLRDITQWKRAEEELTQARGQAEHASSQKTDFLARISHEVRTPLNAIIGFSELMLDEKFGPINNARYRDYLRDINRSGNHVLELVNDLLDISKIEAGEQDMDFESVSLNDALADAVAMMQPDANRERVIIRSSFASNLPEVVADLRSVRQIALNLLSNAIRFTPAGGQVIVSTVYEAAGDVTMRVRDTGIGMSRSEIDQAMKPFKQVSSAKARRRDGTGLGLPLTKAMVEANRASFSIESKPDEGTIVEIVFPSTRVLAD